MIDKQIIIDGVDVSKGNEKFIKNHEWYKAELNIVDEINLAECVHFTRQYDYGYCELSNDSCNQFQHDCKLNKNCYYKQLKRKEQELQKAMDNYVRLDNIRIEKEQECEELKEINAEIEESEIELGNMTNRLLVDYMKYRQVIDEIAKLISDALASPPPKKNGNGRKF